MSVKKHVLAQQLFGKSSVESCSLQEIREMVERFPYYAPAQFLLLEKLKQDNSPEYTEQLQKAVLYYHNPLAFEFFVSSDKFYVEDEPVSFETINTGIHIPDNESYLSKEAEVQKEPGLITEEPLESGMGQNLDKSLELQPEEEIFNTWSETAQKTEWVEEDQQLKHEPEESGENSGLHSEVDTGIESEEKDSEPLVLSENENTPVIPLTGLASTDTNSGKADLPAFEPYHTVDYFASQGIRLSQEEAPKDKFGKQLKSFTEWLKTMKRLPAKEMTVSTDSSTEQVQHMAEDSVHQAEVVTETMAEVWLKQGNAQKALEIYQQLCLINPSKKAYFAAQIEKLKHS